jgi:hypothetical protein
MAPLPHIKLSTRFLLFCFVISFGSCKPVVQNVVIPIQQTLVQTLTNAIVHDIYSPPVSSRIYAYCNLAYYQGLVCKTQQSLTPFLNGFDTAVVTNPAQLNETLVATSAFYTVAHALIFSKDSISKYQIQHLKVFEARLDKQTYQLSIGAGNAIAATILQRAATDNYKQTRGMPRYSAFAKKEVWQQTPPDYADAVEPNWQKIKPFFLDSATQFAPAPPPTYNENKTSPFYQEMLAVYDQVNTPEQKETALFWDDNPFTTQHHGHTTFATKKATPVGHWWLLWAN